MSVAAARGERRIGLRDERRPGHFWADNEIFDVFGDELGPNGILLYITMTRLCWGADVKKSLREIAGHGRMSKSTVDRTMKLLLRIGLVEEQRGDKSRTAPTYSLVDAKQLAAQYVRERLRSVPCGDRPPANQMPPTPNDCNTKASAPMPTLVQLLCPPTGQTEDRDAEVDDAAEDGPASGENAVDSFFCPVADGTELSHPDANLSQNRGPFKYQEPRPQDPVPPPTPRGGGGALSPEVLSESARVMRERSLSDPRLRGVIREAMRLAMDGYGKTPGEVADTMIRRHAEYLESARLLRFTWGPRKFFAEGHWLNREGWPLDQKLLAESRRL